MGEKELLIALDEDTKRECSLMLENAQKEAESILKKAVEEQKILNHEKFNRAAAEIESEKIRMLASAKLQAKEVLLKEKQVTINIIFERTSDRFKKLPMNKEYSKILEKLFIEALEGWKDGMYSDNEVVLIVSKQDVAFVKGFNHIRNFEIVADETGNVSEGVVIKSKDGKHKLINTLYSRLQRARPELVSILDKKLFKEKAK